MQTLDIETVFRQCSRLVEAEHLDFTANLRKAAFTKRGQKFNPRQTFTRGGLMQEMRDFFRRLTA